jgi:polyisoprenyl-phosphate glycosyltransferase
MKKLVSYIFPIYNESGNIDLLYKTMSGLLKKHPEYHYEIVFVNDGSRDDSLERLIALQQKDDRISVINFSRNFGHQLAVTAGLDYASGDAVIIMDSDMQDPPRVSFELLEKWEQGYEVVYAQRRSRKDGFFKKLTAKWFYITLQKLADISIPRDTGDFRLLDRKVVDELNKFRERDRFLRGMVSYIGFKQIGVLFDRDERHAGVTGYPLKKMIKFAIDGILGFSTVPLQLISQIGAFISAISFLGIIYAVIMRIVRPEVTVPGWTFLVIAILFIGGIQLIMLGILGSYIGRIYSESQRRPLYIVSSVFSSKKSHENK